MLHELSDLRGRIDEVVQDAMRWPGINLAEVPAVVTGHVAGEITRVTHELNRRLEGRPDDVQWSGAQDLLRDPEAPSPATPSRSRSTCSSADTPRRRLRT